MKKILLVSLLIAGTVMADNNRKMNRPNPVRNFYIGMGLLYNRVHSKIEVKDGITANGDAIAINLERSEQKIGKFGGSLVFGYGKLFGNFYMGGEILFDIAGDATFNNTISAPTIMTCCSKIDGVVPEIALRCGWGFPSLKALIYTKLGIAYVRTEFQEKSSFTDQKVRKMSKVTPIIGLGVEKAFNKRFNMRGEFVYRFPRTNKKKIALINNAATFNLENHVSGFALRLIAVCKI